MSALLLPFYAILLFCFYLSLTSAASLPLHHNVPRATFESNTNTPTNNSSILLAGGKRPSCLPYSSQRGQISPESCISAFSELNRVTRRVWTDSRYEWVGIGGECTIVLKADKAVPEGGARFDNIFVDVAAEAIVDSCGLGESGPPRGSLGLGGSLGLEATAPGIPEGEWRVWVLGQSRVSDEEGGQVAEVKKRDVATGMGQVRSS